MESLVVWRVFRYIGVSFVPAGHTHEDIDQNFAALPRTSEVTMHPLCESCTSSSDKHMMAMQKRITWSQLWTGLANVKASVSFTIFLLLRTTSTPAFLTSLDAAVEIIFRLLSVWSKFVQLISGVFFTNDTQAQNVAFFTMFWHFTAQPQVL